jgi:hypothetical protein
VILCYLFSKSDSFFAVVFSLIAVDLKKNEKTFSAARHFERKDEWKEFFY